MAALLWSSKKFTVDFLRTKYRGSIAASSRPAHVASTSSFHYGGNTMRRFIPIALLLGLFVAVTSLPARDTEPKFKTAEVKHLTKVDDVDLSQDYLNYAYDHLREDLEKTKLFATVVGDGAAVADADAADSVVVECKIMDYSKGHITVSTGHMDITISRRSDHTVLQHLTMKVGWPAHAVDDYKGKYTGAQAAHEIKNALK
jgi:hypothetical protein